ncbi:MAG: cation diffusion facilitator family transporter [Bacteroidota bacterium]
MNNVIIKSINAGIEHFSVTLFPNKLTKERAFGLAITITLIAMVVEFAVGYWANSLMLISDGFHMLSHALSLMISWAAIKLSNRYKKIEFKAAFINGIGLALFTGYIFYEAIGRVLNPLALSTNDIIIVAVFGLVINLLTALILASAGIEDLNTKSAFLHLLSDTFSSIAIVLGGIVIYFTAWYVIDPMLSIVVGIIIAKWSYGLIKASWKALKE